MHAGRVFQLFHLTLPSQPPFMQDLIVSLHQIDEEPLPPGPSPSREAFLASLTHLRLDRLCISDTPSSILLSLPRITHVYLHHNRLTDIQGLASLPNLKFLTLAHNWIQIVEGISGLGKLLFLDLSFNQIREIDHKQLPASIAFLKVSRLVTDAAHVRGHEKGQG